MTGTCKFCGQTRLVPFECTQEEADLYAAENCACDNNLKKCRQLCENIDKLCGEECKQFGMDIIEESTIDALKEVGRLCVYGYINGASFAIKGTSIAVRQIKDGVSVSRKKCCLQSWRHKKVSSTVYIKRSSEDTEQEVVIQWARMNSGKWPELSLLHHIPNGGSRNKREAARFKRMGVLAGVADLHLPVARGPWHGLYIEMKYGDGRLQSSQKDFLKLAAEQGVYCIVCYSAEDAIDIIRQYVSRDTVHPNLTIMKDGEERGVVK